MKKMMLLLLAAACGGAAVPGEAGSVGAPTVIAWNAWTGPWSGGVPVGDTLRITAGGSTPQPWGFWFSDGPGIPGAAGYWQFDGSHLILGNSAAEASFVVGGAAPSGSILATLPASWGDSAKACATCPQSNVIVVTLPSGSTTKLVPTI